MQLADELPNSPYLDRASRAFIAVPNERDARRLLIMSCSATKRADPHPLAAHARYDGSAWRTWRAAHRALDPASWPTTLVLSAAFGLIPDNLEILDYQQRLDATRSAELVGDPHQLAALARVAGSAAEIYIAGGKLYRSTVLAMLDRLEIGAAVAVRTPPAGAGIGLQLADLKGWILATAAADPINPWSAKQ